MPAPPHPLLTPQTSLIAALAEVRTALIQHSDPDLLAEAGLQDWTVDPTPVPQTDDPDSPLEVLCDLFGLTPFERNLLLLCAGVELDARFAALCAAAQGDGQRDYPTFSLALAIFADSHWSALTGAAPLRQWRLIELTTGRDLVNSPLRIDERVLHYLMGEFHLDSRLLDLVEPVTVTEDLVYSHWQVAEQIVAAWSVTQTDVLQVPVLQLCGPELASKTPVAATACHFLGLHLYTLAAHSLPTIPSDLSQFKRLWERETALQPCALLIDCEDLDSLDTAREGAISHLCEWLRGPVLLAVADRRRARRRPMLAFDLARPTPQEQHAVWQAALGPTAATLNGWVESLVCQFNLSAPVIQAASAQVRSTLGQASEGKSPDVPQLLWDTCRAQARPKLEDLAQRIESAAAWEDLVLPQAQLATLRELAMHVKHRATVYERWAFGGKSGRGLGITALFAGASGTGKTMAAEVLARELRLDLYRIDLSSVISKYIGETEKNLRRVFDAAELGGVILLFDEADALFGKRTEVKDSHDRHANVEVSYLLQRMEAYRGLSVLTTNLKNALDQAFLRRIRFVVQFPFPDAAQRAEIWGRVFPAAAPTAGLDVRKLARLNVAGGNIRNIALNAAFLAAEAGEAVQMGHLLQAAKREYEKLERTMTEGEVRGWV